MADGTGKVVWFDFENAPQVLVLEPLISRLREAGYHTVHTARRFSMTVELCSRRNLETHVLGSGSRSSGRLAKMFRVLQRSLMLRGLPDLGNPRPILGVSHASRSQLLAGKLLGIPVVILDDYEHSDQTLAGLACAILVPDAIPAESWGRHSGLVVHYPGYKENLYLAGFGGCGPRDGVFDDTGTNIRVILRPEGRTTHYHSEESARLQRGIIRFLARREGVMVAVFPRDRVQEREIRELFEGGKARAVFPGVLDGPGLIASSDLVIGGGGTMTREAAALGVPSYSFFSGPWGAVDEQLVREGRLHRIRNSADIADIQLKRRPGEVSIPGTSSLDFVSDYILGLAGSLSGEEPLG
jgi:predicted glycosyltransferase